MAKVLLMDTSFASVPIYNYLIRQQHDVFVMGNRFSDALAVRAKLNWIDQDYSQLDEVLSIIQKAKFDYVVPGCTDLSIEICQKLGVAPHAFDDPEVYKYLGNKDYFRQMCDELNLASPQTQTLNDFPTEGQYICKPVDAFSGRGVSVFEGHNVDDAFSAFEVAKKESTSDSVLIETFITGQLFSYSCFIEQEKVIETFIVREGSSANPYAVDTSFVEHDFSEAIKIKLKDSIESISHYLNLKDGLVHLQFILQGDTPYLIEVTRRCPGDLYSKLIEYSCGFDFSGKFASYFIDNSYSTSLTHQSYIVRHTVTSDDLLNFEVLEFSHKQSMKAYFPLMLLGQEIHPKQKSRVGILFSEFESENECHLSYGGFMNREQYILAN